MPPPSGDGPPPGGHQSGPYGAQPYVGQPYAQPPAGRGQRKSHKSAIITVLLAVALVLAGGAAFAVTKLGGGGQQPAEALPGNAIAYWRMDIDPSVGQKVAAVRFLSTFPKSNGDFTTGDIRKKLWDAAQKDNPSIKDIDYDRDIKPWLGDRLGMSVSAPHQSGDDPMVAVALQVKDEGKAREGIDKILAAVPAGPATSFGASAPIPGGTHELVAKDSDKPDYFFHGDYAVFTMPGRAAEVRSAIDEGPLSDNTTFAGDMDDLGEPGIVSGWADLGGLAERAGDLMGPRTRAEQLKKAGRFAVALRFDSDYLELAGITRGQESTKAPQDEVESAITSLPDDTAVAVALSHGDQIIGNAWDSFMKLADDQSQPLGSTQSAQQLLDEFKERYGIALPEDLQTLVGRNLVIAAPDQDFENTSGPEVVIAGVRVKTDTGKATEVMTKLEKLARDEGSELPLVHHAKGDSFLVATGQPGLDWIARGGRLGDSDSFRLAVPGAKTAEWVSYVDLDDLEHHYLGAIKDDEEREFVKSLRSFGMTAHLTGDGEGSFSIRLVGN
jgi:hypothetical protein